MAYESQAAAKRLLGTGQYRSAISRAYYAVYARITAELVGVVSFPALREGPHHEDLSALMFDYLVRLPTALRWRFVPVVKQLYNQRLVADYRPSRTVDRKIARDVVSLADSVIIAIGEAYEPSGRKRSDR